MVNIALPTREEVVEINDGKYDVRSYQKFGTRFLKGVRRGFLTDDPGLGKTVQAIDAAELPCMVVAPKYLCPQWVDAIKRRDPTARIAYAHGTRKQREETLKKTADWYIVNLEMMNTYDLPSGIRTFINDESHRLRNRTAELCRATNIVENLDSTARIYNLTATPFWKTVDDIWHQCHILYPTIFTSYNTFVDTYCVVLKTPYGVPKVATVKKAMRNGLKDLLKPIMLGRTYKQVGRFLPSTIETTVKIEMPPALRDVYKKLKRSYYLKWQDGEEEQRRLVFQPNTLLHVLRQVTMQSGKIDVIKGILEDSRLGTESGSQNTMAIIGFYYRDHARMMYEALGPKQAVLVTGDIPPDERYKRAMTAQREGKHIVASESSLREGANLSKYRLFIWGEEDYVPEANRQFLSRVVRDRNDNGSDTAPVLVYHVQVANSVDEYIYTVASKRGEAIQATRELLELTLKED